MAAKPMKTKVKELPILAAVENNSLDFIREHADPLLVSAYMTLLPFKDVIDSTSAGPQMGQNEESWILVSCMQQHLNSEIIFQIYADRVTMNVIYKTPDGERFGDGPEEIALPDVWEILRNCARPAHSFIGRGK